MDSEVHYFPRSSFNLNRKVLEKSKSCSVEPRRFSNSSPARPSHFSSSSGANLLSKYPPNYRNGTALRSISSSITQSEINCDESTTSHSIIHGIILVTIMIASLGAFVFSKLKRPCDGVVKDNTKDCPFSVVLFYSIINILSCLTSFTIYFLHLIGQCDCSIKKKLAIEISVIIVVVASLSTSITLLIIRTDVPDYNSGIISVGCSILATVGYVIRMFKLCIESNITKNILFKTNKSHELHQFQVPSIRSTKAISYVRKKPSQEEPSYKSKQQTKSSLNEFSHIELEDDVFFNH